MTEMEMPATPTSPNRYAGGPALFRLIRYWARRGPQCVSQDTTGSSRHLSRIQVVDTVSAVLKGASSDTIANIGTVARSMGVNHSVASRMVSDAVEAGLVRRGVAAKDGRLAELTLTEKGEELAVAARHWQEAVFDDLTRGWGSEERSLFSRLIIRLYLHTAGIPD